MGVSRIHSGYPTDFKTDRQFALAWSDSELLLAWVVGDHEIRIATCTNARYFSDRVPPQWDEPVSVNVKFVWSGVSIGYVGPPGPDRLIFLAFLNGEHNPMIYVVSNDARQVFVHETSVDTPALTYAPNADESWMAWRGDDGRLNTIHGPGTRLTDKIIYGETSIHAPALTCAKSDELTMAWSGDGRFFNAAHITPSGDLTDRVVFDEFDVCVTVPSLCVDDGTVYAAWSNRDFQICVLGDVWNTANRSYQRNELESGWPVAIAYPVIAWIDQGTIYIGRT